MEGALGAMCVIWLLVLGLSVLMLAAMWKVFTKAGRPGWACIVPIYNIIVLLDVVGKPVWWIVLYFIPIANIVVGIMVMIALAENFGKGGGFAAGLIFLPIIFWPILGFGSAKYQGAPPAPAAAPGVPQQPQPPQQPQQPQQPPQQPPQA